jgi:hypothetical protein
MSMSGNKSRVELVNVEVEVGGARALCGGCDGDAFAGVGPMDGGT